MLTITAEEWEKTSASKKNLTPLTKRRQLLWNNKQNPHVDELWLTEGISFIISDKEGSKYANNTNN